MAGFAGKPAKGAGNYGRAVSAAAKAKTNGSTFKQRIGRPLTSDGSGDGKFSRQAAIHPEALSTKIPASRTGSAQSGASLTSVSAPEIRSAAGIAKKTPTEPTRVAGVGQVKNPGIHGGPGQGPDWKPPKTGSGRDYGAAVSAAAQAKSSGSTTVTPASPARTSAAIKGPSGIMTRG